MEFLFVLIIPAFVLFLVSLGSGDLETIIIMGVIVVGMLSGLINYKNPG